MRMVEAWLLVAISLLLGASAPAGANILGGGPKKTDCYAEFEGIDATGSKANVVECVDGTPTCDHDLERGKCTFQFKICSFVTGVDGCTPVPLRKLSPRKLDGRAITVPRAASFGCSEDISVVLKLKKNGKITKRSINVLAQGDGKPSRDPDRLVLRCVPAPASPSGAFVLGNEE
jgi:hypothetical protein